MHHSQHHKPRSLLEKILGIGGEKVYSERRAFLLDATKRHLQPHHFNIDYGALIVKKRKEAEANKKKSGSDDLVRAISGYSIKNNGDIEVHGRKIWRKEAEKEQIPHPLVFAMLVRRRKNGELEFYIQKRSATKKWYPSQHSGSALGEIRHNETVIQAAAREVAEELGVPTKAMAILGKPYINRPKPEDFGGKKLPHVDLFTVIALASDKHTISPDLGEVDPKGCKFMTISEIKEGLKSGLFVKPGSHEIIELIANGKYGDLDAKVNELMLKSHLPPYACKHTWKHKPYHQFYCHLKPPFSDKAHYTH